MKNYLIFGGTGTLGFEIFKLLLDQGDTCTIVTRSPVSVETENLELDLLDNESLDKINFQKFDRVIYAAQSRNYKHSQSYEHEIFQLNYQIPMKLANICELLEIPFAYTSTGSIYESKSTPLTESDSWRKDGTHSIYTASKVAAEAGLAKYEKSKILRPFYIYGSKSSERMLIPTLFTKILKDERIELSGDKGMIFNPINAVDAALATICMLESDVKVCNVAGDEIVSMLNVIEILSDLLNKTPNLTYTPSQTNYSVADISLLKTLGYNNKYSLKEGLEHFVENYKN